MEHSAAKPLPRPTVKPQRWGVVGGGFLGLMLAHRLAQAGQKVTLFEAAPSLGGLAGSWQLGPITWDRYYHVILLSDLTLRGLLTELGLDNDFVAGETRTGFYVDGKLYSMSNTKEFLQFPPLHLFNKIRLGATIFYASRIKNWQRLESIPVADWLRKWSGNSTFEKIWLPLLKAKLGDNYTQASAAFIWAIIARMYAARRSGMKKEMFGYVRGGYARILERFAEKLRAEGVTLRTGCPVRQVVRNDDKLCVETETGTEVFDKVVVTSPAPVAASLCPQLKSDETERLNGILYQGIVCASLLMKEPLADYYVTNITDSWVPFTAVIETSALVDRKEFGGNSLVYLPKYVVAGDPAFETSDEQLREAFLAALNRMYPNFRRENVLAFQVSRVKHVLAIATLNYSQRLPPMQTSVPGLWIVNSAHIVNGTLNVNETLQLAERATPMLLAEGEA